MPNLTPDVTIGDWSSKGTMFLLTVKSALTKACSACLPVTDLLVDYHLQLDPLSQIDAFQLLANGLTRKKLWHKVPTSEAKGVSENHFSLTVSTDKVSALEEMINLVAGHPLIIKLIQATNYTFRIVTSMSI